MYLRMIEDCVKELKGIRVEEEVDPLLNIPVSAYIPENYISDSSQRLITYKRLSSAREISDLDGLRLEVEDRFGRPPEEVMNLFMVMELRLFAKKLKIIRVDWKIGSGISIQFSKDNKISNKGIDYLLNPKKKIRFTSEFSLEIQADMISWDQVFQVSKEEMLRLL